MKDNYRQVSLSRCCRLLGVTRQAFYQHYWHIEEITFEQEMVLQQVQYFESIIATWAGERFMKNCNLSCWNTKSKWEDSPLLPWA